MTKADQPSVLYVVPSAGIGGAETFLRHVATYSKSYQPIFALLRDGPLAEALRATGHPVYVIEAFPRLSRPLSIWKSVYWLSEIARKHHCLLVHSTMSYGAIFGSLCARRLKIPHLWYQHGPVSGWMDQVAGLLPAKVLLTNSQFSLNQQHTIEKKVKISKPKRRDFILRLGVDWQEADSNFKKETSVESTSGKNVSPLRVVMLCRPQEWKGIHLFIEALSLVPRETPIEAKYFGGAANESSANDYEKKLRAMATKLSVSIQFAGATKTPFTELQKVDVLVNASTTPEPFGLSIIEAMAAGAVPIAPRAGGPLEIFEHRKSGLHFHPGDSQDLAKQLVFLAENPNELESLRKQVKIIAQTKYNAKNCIAELEDTYDQIL